MSGRLSRLKSSILKMLEISSRLVVIEAMSSMFSGACDQTWSAGTFMAVAGGLARRDERKAARDECSAALLNLYLRERL